MNTATNLPKSLHTVTVLVNVARTMKGAPIQSKHDATISIIWAMGILGYDNSTDDSYGLADKAAAQLLAEAQRTRAPVRAAAMPRGCEAVKVSR